jgi:hypothetical protein
LGNAVRLVRIDHGVRIEMDPMETAGGSASGRPHYMTGRIYYDNDRAESAGTLLYVKPALSGDEPIDVVNYAKDHPSFPHESTANQWFTEAQFESYRMLGLHSIETALASNAAAVTRLGDPS